jgi:hypothetical protein
MFRYSLVLAVGLVAAGSASASWADAMFAELNCDFGAVPHGPQLVHPFRLTNNTGVPVTIGSIRVSCGCTSAHAKVADLAPGQSTAVVAEMDSQRFQGHKQVTIFVEFTRPSYEEVQLTVQANSRDDIVITPLEVNFGVTRKAATPTASVTVTLFGNTQWRITGVASESNYVQPSLVQGPANLVQVNYQVKARLRPDTPVGKWFTVVWLTTNDPSAARVRLPVTVTVR